MCLADVWAFGVLCWEMYTGQRAYRNVQVPRILLMHSKGEAVLELPAEAPQSYKASAGPTTLALLKRLVHSLRTGKIDMWKSNSQKYSLVAGPMI